MKNIIEYIEKMIKEKEKESKFYNEFDENGNYELGECNGYIEALEHIKEVIENEK